MILYLMYVKKQLKTNFIYRGSSFMAMIGQTLNNIASFIAIYILFQKFHTLNGYSFGEILITYSVVTFTFSFSEMMFRGFDEFDRLIGMGTLDALLLRPRNIVLQICGQKIETMKLGRVVFSLALLVVACVISPVQWSIVKVIVLIEMLIAGVIVFFGIFLLTATVTIFTIKTPEFVNVLTYGGREICYYPLDVFKKFITKFFTFIIPYATFNYIPLKYLLYGSSAGIFAIFYPWVSIVFAVICCAIFNYCLRFYKSAG